VEGIDRPAAAGRASATSVRRRARRTNFTLGESHDSREESPPCVTFTSHCRSSRCCWRRPAARAVVLFQDTFTRTTSNVSPLGTGWASATTYPGTWDVNGSYAVLNQSNNLGGQYVPGVDLAQHLSYVVGVDLRRPDAPTQNIGTFDVMGDWNGVSLYDNTLNTTGVRLTISNPTGSSYQIDLNSVISDAHTSLYSATFNNTSWPGSTFKSFTLQRYGNNVRAVGAGVFDTGWLPTTVPHANYAGFFQHFVFGNTNVYSTSVDNFTIDAPEPGAALAMVASGGLLALRRRGHRS
jgi:hypothetical protein